VQRISRELFWRKNFNNLLGVDDHTRAFEEYPNLAPGGLVYNRRYFGLDNLAAIEFDPNARAYAVIHIASILPRYEGGWRCHPRRAWALPRVQRRDMGELRVKKISQFFLILLLTIHLDGIVMRTEARANPQTVGPAKGWLIIQGGGNVTNEVKERFVALAGGADKNFVFIPTAMSDQKMLLAVPAAKVENVISPDKMKPYYSRWFDVNHVTVLHTRDRARANSDGFAEPLRHASGVFIDGGRQWRLADVYLGTAVEREIKALLARGGVVCGGSAGATIQGSFLVRGAPGNARNPDGDNTIMISQGHETGFGLLSSSAIDQHVNTKGREGDLDAVISAYPELLAGCGKRRKCCNEAARGASHCA
jgi:cyanophycinase